MTHRIAPTPEAFAFQAPVVDDNGFPPLAQHVEQRICPDCCLGRPARSEVEIGIPSLRGSRPLHKVVARGTRIKSGSRALNRPRFCTWPHLETAFVAPRLS